MEANQFRESVYGMLEHLPEGMRRGQYLINYIHDFFPKVMNRIDPILQSQTFNNDDYIDRFVGVLYKTISKLQDEVVEFIMDNYDVQPDDIVVSERAGWMLYINILSDITLKKDGEYTNGVFVFNTIYGNFDVSNQHSSNMPWLMFDEVKYPKPNRVLGDIIRLKRSDDEHLTSAI